MKMKFNYLMTAALALTVGFASCSSDENAGGGTNVTPEGVKTYADINLTQAGISSYAPVLAPTGDEAVMKTATVYVFNSTRNLESQAALTVAVGGATAGKNIEITTGKKTFYIVVNEPTVASLATKVTTGMTVADFEEVLINVTAMLDLTAPSTAKGFFMTNTTRPTEVTIVEGGNATTPPAANKQTIQVGRAFSKANVEYPATAQQPASGVLTAVQYKVKQQPKAVNLMPYLNAGVLESAYHVKSEGTTAPVAADYFHNTVLKGTDGLDANASYMMENSNKKVKQGNATYALLTGIFTPITTYDDAGAAPLAGVTGADFWRIGTIDPATKEVTYTGKYYRVLPPQAELNAETGTTLDPNVSAYKYTGGKAFYALFFADNSKTGDVKHTIARNSYFYATVTSVGDCGSNDEEGVIIDPTAPLITSAHIEAAITVVDWTGIDQQTGI